MGALKQLEIEAMENDFPLTYDNGEESHYHMILDGFKELVERYGVNTVVSTLSAELKFDLLEAIIKSQGKLMKGN